MSNSNRPSPETTFDAALFRAPEQARHAVRRLSSAVSEDLLTAVLTLLPESPDPDQSLNLLECLITSGSERPLKQLGSNQVLLHYVLLIFGHSYWLGETIVQQPGILTSLAPGKHLERSPGQEDYRESFARLRSQSTEADIAVLLARFKKREYVRILLRDVLGVATLAETTAELSALADVILQEALQQTSIEMRRRFGQPEYEDAGGRLSQAPFTVLSLGKLGGNELNYSSDVDLMFLYGGEEAGHSVPLSEYFARQAQMVTDLLTRPTPEGAVFRIDLRLRPQGSEGPLAMSLSAALDYYSRKAHDWELQALIKARCSAGNTALAREFIQQTQSRVYTKDLNFAAIETALHSREKIQSRRASARTAPKVHLIDVKLDRGGIRDIEFLVQCLQRVYGGEERWLRSGGTLFSLQKLHDKGHIAGKDFHDLTVAYGFLRRIEHRLQVRRGQQLHRLPHDLAELLVLARSLQPESTASAGDLLLQVKEQMSRVADIYERIVHSHRRREQTLALSGQRPASAGTHEMSFAQLLERLAQDSPRLHEIASAPGLSLHARRGLHRFLASAVTSRERSGPLLEDPHRLELAVKLLETSEHLTEELVRHPDVLQVLDQVRFQANVFRPETVLAGGKPLSSSTDALAALRTSFRKAAFTIGAQDVLSPRSAFESLAESSRLADLAVHQALEIVHGEETIAVFALGRLGTNEFDIASDADLLFVRPEPTDEGDARSAAEKLIHALSAYTREGTIFAVDTRLRPHGSEGELVVTPAQLERYLQNEAQPWEALSYTKLRFVAGRDDLARTTVEAAWRHITTLAARPGFTQAVVEMRTRLEKANRYPHSFKLARGGFYDIDFIASYLILRGLPIGGGNAFERLEHLHSNGNLRDETFAQLRQGAILYRTADHIIRLITGRARPELPEAEHAREAVENLVSRILGQDTGWSLQQNLNQTAERVRKIFEQVVTDL